MCSKKFWSLTTVETPVVSTVLFFISPLLFPSSNAADLFRCAFLHTRIGINIMLKTLKFWILHLYPKKHHFFPETGPFSKKKIQKYFKGICRVSLILMLLILPLFPASNYLIADFHLTVGP